MSDKIKNGAKDFATRFEKVMKELKEEEDVQVAPGIWQSKEDYEANRDYDAMKDGENFV